MRPGFQTIIWGPHVEDFDSVLDAIAAAGYHGVEISQRPDSLGNDMHDIAGLLRAIERRGLTLIGLAGGTLKERMDFCEDFRPSYLYVEEWDEHLSPQAVQMGFRLALHPHLFKAIHRLSDAEELLANHPELWFLPDTAHLTVAGDDPVKAVELMPARLAGVHLKDWTPDFGRSYHRYARGFTELGTGSVKPERVLAALRKLDYREWVVIEQDTTRIGPEASMIRSAEWLARNQLPLKPLRPMSPPTAPRDPLCPPRTRRCPPEAEARFLHSVISASVQGLADCYGAMAEAFAKLVPCHLVSLWAYSPAKDLMGLLAVAPDHVKDVRSTTRKADGLSIEAIARQTVTHFNLGDPNHREQFLSRDLIDAMGLKHMVSIPIANPWNPNHTWLLANLFPHEQSISLTDAELAYFGRHLALAADRALDDRCSYFSSRANVEAARSRSAKDLLDRIRKLIQEALDCEGVSIFLVNDLGHQLEEKATSGIDWFVANDRRFYGKGEGLLGKVWERNETLLAPDATHERYYAGISAERVESTDRHEYLFSPLVRPPGGIIGVTRCRNKRAPSAGGWSNMFSDQDAAIVDAIGQAAVPHLSVLMAQERRVKALGKLVHELGVPLVAVRGAIDEMWTTREVRAFFRRTFDYDYLGDIRSWSELMARLVDNAELYQEGVTRGIRLRVRPTLLRKQVIAPAVRRVERLLRNRGFSQDNITRGSFNFPALYVDQNLFQQVVFNLLSNAIKHCFADPSSFQVEIGGEERDAEFQLWFRDWGPGIEEGMEEVIFLEGVRGPHAEERDVAGQGLGLWLVRQVVEAHGGRISVTHLKNPTEFRVFLPESLAQRAPAAIITREATT